MTDEEIVLDVLAGRADAFGELVKRHRAMAYRLCYRMVGDHHAAEDLSQEAFLRAHQGLAGFRGESSFRSWLLRIAANLSITWRRSPARAQEPTAQMPERAAAATSPEGEFQRRLEQAILRLPEKQRLTLTLRVHENL